MWFFVLPVTRQPRWILDERIAVQEHDPEGGPEPTPPKWLFVLGSHDLWYQQLQNGVDAFAQVLTCRLEEAERFGRRPSVIGPQALLEQLSTRLSSRTTVELMHFCGYHDFVARLFEAEYVFYWNLFSASFLLRLTRGLPAFFFDRGHLSRLIARMYPLGLRVFLQQWEPQYLALSSQLDQAHLRAQARDQELRFKEIVAYWEQSPTPDELFDVLLGKSDS